MKPDLLTRFVFNETVIVEVSSDYQNSIMVEVMNYNDPKGRRKSASFIPR